MRRALILSAAFHVALGLLLLTGLPDFGEKLEVEEAVTVDIVAEPASLPDEPPEEELEEEPEDDPPEEGTELVLLERESVR